MEIHFTAYHNYTPRAIKTVQNYEIYRIKPRVFVEITARNDEKILAKRDTLC